MLLLTPSVPIADVNCFMPANGETTTIFTNPSIPVDISLGILKRETATGDTFLMNVSSVMFKNKHGQLLCFLLIACS